jgi:hypothetical protein
MQRLQQVSNLVSNALLITMCTGHVSTQPARSARRTVHRTPQHTCCRKPCQHRAGSRRQHTAGKHASMYCTRRNAASTQSAGHPLVTCQHREVQLEVCRRYQNHAGSYYYYAGKHASTHLHRRCPLPQLVQDMPALHLQEVQHTLCRTCQHTVGAAQASAHCRKCQH